MWLDIKSKFAEKIIYTLFYLYKNTNLFTDNVEYQGTTLIYKLQMQNSEICQLRPYIEARGYALRFLKTAETVPDKF